MAGYRELAAWQVAREVSEGAFLLARDRWVPWGAALFGQLQRAALSVQLNIAEGWSFGPSPSRSRHIGIAYGSAIETGELLELAMSLDIASRKHLTPLLLSNQRCQRLLVGLLKRVRPV